MVTDNQATVQSVSSPQQIVARLERLPITRWQVKARVVVGAVTFFDGFDQLMISYSLPELRPKWGLSSSDTSWMIAYGGIGMLLGALAGGWLADRIGRLRVVQLSLLVYALASLIMAIIDSESGFAAMRVVQGLGLGAEVPVAASYISEITKARGRGKFILLYETIFPVGLVASAVVSSWLVPHLGYKWLLALGALPVLLIPTLMRLPESPRWYSSRGRHDEADAACARIEAEVLRRSRETELPPVDPAVVSAPLEGKGRFTELFSPTYRRRSCMIAVAWFTGFFVNYGITAWLPSIYTSVFGVDVSTALHYSIVTSVAGLLGCVAVALLIDKLGRRICLSVALGTCAIPLLVLAALGASSAQQVVWLTALSALFNFAVNMSLYVYTAELFPTRVRAMGMAWGGAAARLGIIFGPLIVGHLLGATGNLGSIFFMFALVAAAGAIVIGVFAVETTGRTLEDISK